MTPLPNGTSSITSTVSCITPIIGNGIRRTSSGNCHACRLDRTFGDLPKQGQRLGEIHIGYEDMPEYQLAFIENREVSLDWRVEKMKLSKDKTQLVYNDFLTLDGIPAKVFDYRLGNRSALEWVIDQYCVKTDKRSGIINDPNRPDDPQYIVRLIGRVIAVSLETVGIVEGLPDLELSTDARSA